MFLLVFIEILTELSTYLWVTLLSVDLTRFFILEKLLVSDYSTKNIEKNKIKKSEKTLILELTFTKDILDI
jgi:phosphopantothenoylcysteine synthetase/decarboxylase